MIYTITSWFIIKHDLVQHETCLFVVLRSWRKLRSSNVYEEMGIWLITVVAMAARRHSWAIVHIRSQSHEGALN